MPDFSKQRKKTTQIIKKVGSHAVTMQSSSSQHVSKYVTRRKQNIVGAKRFIASWLLLVVILCGVTITTLLQVSSAARVPASDGGGTYTEGVVGSVNNLNPLFATGSIDDSVAKLIFNGLFRHDERGNLVPDAAKSMKIGDDKQTYTVALRDDVRWHDGPQMTAEDVVYTIRAIQDSETRSTLYASWQGIKVTAVNQTEVKFELPAPFAPFPNALTVPILPSHILSEVPNERLRTAKFNTQPVGTGPFVFSTLRDVEVRQQKVELAKNEEYFRGEPKLDRFILHLFPEDDMLAEALKSREITAAVDLKEKTISEFQEDKSIRSRDSPLNSGVFAFFKTTNPLLDDEAMRRALAQAINRQDILKLTNARYAPLKTPLLRSQLGFDDRYSQKTDVVAAKKALDKAGWKVQPDGFRAKGGQKLEFELTTVNSAQYSSLASELQRQWAAVGVSVKPQLLSTEQLQQTALSAHAYDILLYGVSIGHDPDVYAYWHSSQARSGGLNFSEWSSSRADSSLDTARTRLESVLRQARYETFQDEWRDSAPAVALYQPRVNYSYHQNARGFIVHPLNTAADRLTNVENWSVNTKKVDRTP